MRGARLTRPGIERAGLGRSGCAGSIQAALAAIPIAIALAIGGCGSDGDSSPAGSDPPTASSEGPDGATPKLATGDGRGGVRLELLGEFEQPLYVTEAPGGDQIYVVEKTGRVRVIEDGRTLPAPFLDLSEEVSTSSEQGLLSIAFAPDYQSSRLLYAYYTDLDGNQRVVSYRARSRLRVDQRSRGDLLFMEDFAANHNGGLLAFGPDGLLYVGTGDGGGGGDPERNAQDLSSPLGKILRVKPCACKGGWRVPKGNPFAGKPGGAAAQVSYRPSEGIGDRGIRGEIYSYGLRNPWRYAFDHETGALVIGDVGQDEFEEIDYVAKGAGAGANFGWSAYEGDARFNDDQEAPDHVSPVLTYGRDRGCSITGGYVVRDPELATLYGRYLYGDYCVGELRSVILDNSEASDDRPVGLTVPSLSSFGEGAGGRLYVTSVNGSVFRLASE